MKIAKTLIAPIVAIGLSGLLLAGCATAPTVYRRRGLP